MSSTLLDLELPEQISPPPLYHVPNHPMLNRIVILTLFILIHLTAPQVFAEADHSKNLKIGAVLSLTRDAANNGAAIQKGMTLAIEELRSHGWTIDVNFQDDATNPTKTVSSVQFLLARDYRLFVGPTWSFLINAVKPLLERSDSIAIVPAGSSDINGGSSKAVFNLCPKRIGDTF